LINEFIGFNQPNQVQSFGGIEGVLAGPSDNYGRLLVETDDILGPMLLGAASAITLARTITSSEVDIIYTWQLVVNGCKLADGTSLWSTVIASQTVQEASIPVSPTGGAFALFFEDATLTNISLPGGCGQAVGILWDNTPALAVPWVGPDRHVNLTYLRIADGSVLQQFSVGINYPDGVQTTGGVTPPTGAFTRLPIHYDDTSYYTCDGANINQFNSITGAMTGTAALGFNVDLYPLILYNNGHDVVMPLPLQIDLTFGPTGYAQEGPLIANAAGTVATQVPELETIGCVSDQTLLYCHCIVKNSINHVVLAFNKSDMSLAWQIGWSGDNTYPNISRGTPAGPYLNANVDLSGIFNNRDQFLMANTNTTASPSKPFSYMPIGTNNDIVPGGGPTGPFNNGFGAFFEEIRVG